MKSDVRMATAEAKMENYSAPPDCEKSSIEFLCLIIWILFKSSFWLNGIIMVFNKNSALLSSLHYKFKLNLKGEIKVNTKIY